MDTQRNNCPGQSAEMCWRIFVVSILEDFAGAFPGGFFWALFPTKMRRKNPARKSSGTKIKIREKSALPKAGPKNKENRKQQKNEEKEETKDWRALRGILMPRKAKIDSPRRLAAIFDSQLPSPK